MKSVILNCSRLLFPKKSKLESLSETNEENEIFGKLQEASHVWNSYTDKFEPENENILVVYSVINRFFLGAYYNIHCIQQSILKKIAVASLHNELKCGKKIHFGRTMYCLPQKLKSMFFEKISRGMCPKGTRSKEKITKKCWF